MIQKQWRWLPLEWRFWLQVLPVDSGCWEWQGGTRVGYGAIISREHQETRAHRVAYAMMVGDPKGWDVCHHCDNPPCVNPAHLFLGTQADNSRDMHAKGRARNPFADRHRAQTHCKHGHEFTPENTYRYHNGLHRQCRACTKKRLDLRPSKKKLRADRDRLQRQLQDLAT